MQMWQIVESHLCSISTDIMDAAGLIYLIAVKSGVTSFQSWYEFTSV